MMRVGAYSWVVAPLRDEAEFWARLRAVLEQASEQQIDHLVLPESLVLELASLFPDLQGEPLIRRLCEFEAEFLSEIEAVVLDSGLSVTAGSHFAYRDGMVYNESASFLPTGMTIQPKNVMTQFECKEWGISGASALRPYRLGSVTATTLACYDCEFPEAGRAACEAGALLLNVPAFTETRRGFQRVRWACQARAVENQVFVAHSSLLGSLGREPVPSTAGTSAILCPSVKPFPESAVLAETSPGEPGFAVADLDFDMLLACREQDDVRNWNDRHQSQWQIENAP